MRNRLLPLDRPWRSLAAALALIAGIGVRSLGGQTAATTSRAEQIIAGAIARRHALLAPIHDYNYQLSVKLVIRNLDKPPDSMSSVALTSETRSRAEWRSPGHYLETIIARRHSNHLGFVWNTVSVLDIGNFQRNRIEILPHSIPSPIGDNALKHYRFSVLDSLVVDGRRALRLEVTPRTPGPPSFSGTVDILDSTYDVTAIDVGVTDAARYAPWKQIRFQERFENTGTGGWMPHAIRLTGEGRMSLKLPLTPRHLAFEQEAWLDDFRFNSGERPVDLNEVRVEVEPGADHWDNSAWSSPGPITHSVAESRLWAHKDSSDRKGHGPGSRIWRAFNLNQVTLVSTDFFHFSRVDGAYAGLGASWRQTDDLSLTAKLGYANGSKLWQERVGAAYELSEAHRFWIGAVYHDETVNRPGLIPHLSDRTVEALLYRRDPLDYYRERGQIYSAGFRPFDYTRFELHVSDQEQSELPVVTDYSVLKPSRARRANGFIVDGRMRSISASLTYDSRPLQRRNDLDTRLPTRTWNRVVLSAEVASPSLIPNDFNFGRYSLQLERQQRTLGLGITRFNALFGVALGTVPPQRYIVIDFGIKALGFQGGGLKTLGDSDYAGTRVAMVSIQHDFNRLLFARSGLPLIRNLPFTLRMYGTAFVIDFANHVPYPGDSAFHTSPRPYTEAGIALGNLLPFLAPFDLAVQFTWQLSSQSTRKFQVGLDLSRP